ncbi:WXG100 family type VII secretion target [Catenuloplanes nepalensis]|uniref:ESAT-6-like protein n=1 Tax=Catenuloplanes nepalensis TaxID=587533 RepID=A0ABT9N5D0_9ACTN|nr:WXG100 family type VII secretion target [Catenuloplanes nepalensis]MDP9798893.1 WXG100 family type VII secretion target [Catenuloplanes nepalensis]
MTEATTVDPAALVGVATTCDDAAAGLRTLLGGMLTRLDDGRAAWQGEGGTAFGELRAAWARDQESLVAALTGTAAMLRATAAAYVAADDDAAVHLAGLFGAWSRS